MLAITLTAQARHIGNRYRREDKQQTEATVEKKSEDFAALLLRNLVVGPPVGAPHISLNVNSKIDDGLVDLINDANKKLKIEVQEKVDEGGGEEAKKPTEEKKEERKEESADNKGSSPPTAENNSANADNPENNKSDTNDKKADAPADNKDDGGKDTPKESESAGDASNKTPEQPADGTGTKKPDDKSNDKPKRSNDSGRGRTTFEFGYSF